MPTFVGMPPFPEAARAALADTQLRHNLAHATTTIRDKRARVVAEVADWEDLRVAGAAIKDATLADLEHHLLQLESAITAAGGTVHWARDARRGQPHRRRDRQGPRRRRGGQGQVDGHPGDRAQRGLGRRGHRRLGDRPRGADRAAGRRPAQPHPGARRSTATVRRSGRSSASGWPLPARRRPTTSPTTRRSWPERHGCTCARSSCAPRSRSPAPTSPSPRPGRSSSSSRRATAGCA